MTNRAGELAKIDPPAASSWGVDTVRLGGPVSCQALAITPHQVILRRLQPDTGLVEDFVTSGHVDLRERKVRLGRHKGGARWSFEASLPKLVATNNLRLLSPPEARELLCQVAVDVGDALGDERLPELAVVERLDVAIDFRDVEDISLVLECLKQTRVLHGRQNSVLHSNPATGRASSLRKGGADLFVRAYDKHQELLQSHADRADLHLAAGVLRVEVQARSPVLRRKGVRTVADLTEDRCWDILTYCLQLMGLAPSLQ